MSWRIDSMMQNKLIEMAQYDPLIRAVVLNGSRVSPSAKRDAYQDYDVIYVVDEVEPFVSDTGWIKAFGEPIIIQKPDEMNGAWPNQSKKFTFLMLFESKKQIDLTFIEKGYYLSQPIDSQTQVLLDKEGILAELPKPSDVDYLPIPPSQKQFDDSVNEFLWTSQNVAKGILRQELTYAKYMNENILRKEIIKLLSWHAGIQTNFSKNLGSYGRYLQAYIEPDLWSKLKSTYVGADYEKMWEALFGMFELLDTLAEKISQQFNFNYDRQQCQGVMAYLKDCRKESDIS